MRFAFKERKSAQAAAHLLALHNGKMNYMKLIKLLYLADRLALIETGQTITGDRMFSLPKGAILSRILDLASTGEADEGSPWLALISEPVRFEVELRIQPPPTDELSPYELSVLGQINRRFGAMDQWALGQLTHGLPEYRDPDGSRVPIEPEQILREAGKSPDEIEQLTQEAEEVWFLDRLKERTSCG
jgi:hypothetical protein